MFKTLEKTVCLEKIKFLSWVTKVMLSKEREHQIRSCFSVPVEFFYTQNVSELSTLVDNFQIKKDNKSDDDDQIFWGK